MSLHTKGLLHVCSHSAERLRDSDGGYVGDTSTVMRSPEERKANTRRLAACWNACDGLPQDALDGGWSAKGISAYAQGLEQHLRECLYTVDAMRIVMQASREDVLVAVLQKESDRIRLALRKAGVA